MAKSKETTFWLDLRQQVLWTIVELVQDICNQLTDWNIRSSEGAVCLIYDTIDPALIEHSIRQKRMIILLFILQDT